MDNGFIQQMEPWFGEEEKRTLCRCLEEGSWLTEFKRTAEFERMIAEYTGARHCIVVNNGTISLTLAAMACGIKAGDEVIVPNFTMIATPNSLQIFGGIPVFADVEPQTLCLDIAKTREKISGKTKAIMLVSINGRYPRAGIGAFVKIAKEKGIALVEDAAQSLGSFYPDGRHMGTVGSVGSISFSSQKIISTGQGGALITNDDEIALKLRKLKDFGRVSGGNDIYDSIGYNFKFTELQACIGIEQMKKLPWRVNRKKEMYRLYKELLKDIKEISFFDHDLTHTTPWFIDVLADKRDELQRYLMAKGIATRKMYPPINRQKAYNLAGDYPVSDMVGEKGLWLPSASQLTDGQIEKITESIKDFYNT